MRLPLQVVQLIAGSAIELQRSQLRPPFQLHYLQMDGLKQPFLRPPRCKPRIAN